MRKNSRYGEYLISIKREFDDCGESVCQSLILSLNYPI